MKIGRNILPLACVAGACALGDNQTLLPPTPPGHPYAYVSQGLDFRDDIFLLSADGKTDSNLTRRAGFDSWPSWSPDGKRMALVSERARTGNSDIYIMTLDGSAADRRVTFDSVSQDAQPAWSPLGNRIAFVSTRDSAQLDIYLMDTTGAAVARLTSDPQSSSQPAWSPDGARIAFASDRTGNAEIFTMDTLGGNLVNLTNNSATDLTPAWSPDGQKIAFMSDRGGANFAIWVMNADGSSPLRVSNSTPPCELPHWEPGGQRILFDCDGDIFTVTPTGTNRVQLTHTGNTQRSEIMARWQP